MKKRNKLWIAIGIGAFIFIVIMLVSAVLETGERLRQISKYIECNGEPWFSLLEKGAVNTEEEKEYFSAPYYFGLESEISLFIIDRFV